MVFTQIIHSQSGSFHSRDHWQSIKSRNSLCWYKRSDMELGRFVWFICSQIPLENSSDHCEQNLPCKESSPPHKQAVSSSPLRSKHRQQEPIAAGRYSRAPHPNCFDYRQYVPRHPDKHWRGEAPGLPGHGCIFQHYSTLHYYQHATSRHPTVFSKSFPNSSALTRRMCSRTCSSKCSYQVEQHHTWLLR